jgi:hypothetical protein
MPETPEDPTAAFAEELAKQLPVKAIYRDALKPAAKQTGQLAQDIVKTIQLALAPLQFLALIRIASEPLSIGQFGPCPKIEGSRPRLKSWVLSSKGFAMSPKAQRAIDVQPYVGRDHCR